MRSNVFLVLVCSIFLFGCASSNTASDKNDTLSATSLQPYGRYAYTNDQKLELISSAVHFAFSFRGKECRIFASIPDWLERNYIQYELDGVYQKRIRITRNSSQPIIITADKEGKHTVKIYKATEATTGAVFVERITGTDIQPIRPPDRKLIEFIGNSITCGAAADPSEVPCNTAYYHDQHSAYHAYGPGVARRLGVNFILSSVSGIGIYRNWNSDGPTMPQVYKKTDFQEQSNRMWDFKKYQPVIVSIALGTNDYSDGDGKSPRLPFDSASFVTNYIKFVQQVKGIYPAAQIVLLSSPMLQNERRIKLNNCIAAVKKNIDALYPSAKPIAVHIFKPLQPRGCTGHPSIEDHEILAEELVPVFKKLVLVHPDF